MIRNHYLRQTNDSLAYLLSVVRTLNFDGAYDGFRSDYSEIGRFVRYNQLSKALPYLKVVPRMR